MTEPVVTSDKLYALRRETKYAYHIATCRQALESAGGNVNEALAILKERQPAPSTASNAGHRVIEPDTPAAGQRSIADRVRFWEEQDRINRELIPRVIRQHELLTGHIAEHESLPEVVARAISEALATARQEQQRQFAEALGEARTELAQQFDARLQQALEQLDSALNTARAELSNEVAADLARALAELQSALTSHQTRLDDQHQSNLQQALTAIQTEARKSRNLLIGIAAGSAAISIALIVVNLLTG